MAGLFDTINEWFAGTDMAGQSDLYEPQDYAQARRDLLGGLGGVFLSAGMSPPGQRGQIFAQGLPQAMGGYRGSLQSGLKERLAGEEIQQNRKFDQMIQTGDLTQMGFNENQITLLRGMPRATRNKVLEEAMTAQFDTSQRHAMGLQLQYWTDENGQLHAGQLAPDGGIQEVQIPGGGAWAPPMQNIDLGTTILRKPARGGGAGEVLPKDIAGEAAAKEEGKATGEAGAMIQSAEFQAQQTSDLVNQMMADQNGLEWAVGGSSMYGSIIPGSPGADFSAKAETLKSQLFLNVIPQLRGFGALSNTEGQTAMAAISNLALSQSEEQYRQQLMTIKQIVDKGVQVLRARAKQPGASNGGAVERYGGVTIEEIQ